MALCPLVRDSEPIRLLEIPTSPSLYMLILIIETYSRNNYIHTVVLNVYRAFSQSEARKSTVYSTILKG